MRKLLQTTLFTLGLNLSLSALAVDYHPFAVTYLFEAVDAQNSANDFVTATQALSQALRGEQCLVEMKQFFYQGPHQNLSAQGELVCVFVDNYNKNSVNQRYQAAVTAAKKVKVRISSNERRPRPGFTISN